MMTAERILVVDDDRNLLEIIQMRLEASGYAVTTTLVEDEARRIVGEQSFDLAIVDLQLARQDGISLMEELHQVQPDMPVIILTAHGSIESAVEAMQRGAYTYLTKPFDHRELILQMERAQEKSRLTSEVKRLKGMLHEKFGFANIVAKSDKMRRVLETVSRIAYTESNVFLYGASGTGKELIAKAIHLVSPRRDKPFLAINCSAIPESLLESELFGYEKGAFTGAVKKSKGFFAQADTGTIFLDEIGDMPYALQAKLLRVLQERQFHPLGSDNKVEVDVRIIAATNKNLMEEVQKGRFREDLYYRIHVIPIELPALKDRKEDIPSLVDNFLKQNSKKMGKKISGISPAAMQRLMLHDWPGNVRELMNTIEYAVAMTRDDVIGEEYILSTGAAAPAPAPLTTLKQARNEFEKNYLTNLLRVTTGNVSKAAELAGRYRADFYKLLAKYDLTPVDFKKD
jgi:two-component system response regulator GlrR